MNRDVLDRVTARCLSIVGRYRDGEGSARARAQLAAEVEVVVAHLLDLDLAPGEAEARALATVEGHLVARLGAEAGGRLNAAFIAASDAASRNPLARPGPAIRPDLRVAAGRTLGVRGWRGPG